VSTATLLASGAPDIGQKISAKIDRYCVCADVVDNSCKSDGGSAGGRRCGTSLWVANSRDRQIQTDVKSDLRAIMSASK
jgi:hypothetical protein